MKKYQIIYADPPWSYRDKRDKHPRLCGGASVHYKTIETKELKHVPVQEMTDKNCMLFMWATFPNMPVKKCLASVVVCGNNLRITSRLSCWWGH